MFYKGLYQYQFLLLCSLFSLFCHSSTCSIALLSTARLYFIVCPLSSSVQDLLSLSRSFILSFHSLFLPFYPIIIFILNLRVIFWALHYNLHCYYFRYILRYICHYWFHYSFVHFGLCFCYSFNLLYDVSINLCYFVY